MTNVAGCPGRSRTSGTGSGWVPVGDATAPSSSTRTANAARPAAGAKPAAKAVCQTCPVRAECAAHALAAREPYGVWGGFTEAERLRLLAAGWEDLADRSHGRVDVGRLEARLGLRPPSRSSVRRRQRRARLMASRNAAAR